MNYKNLFLISFVFFHTSLSGVSQKYFTKDGEIIISTDSCFKILNKHVDFLRQFEALNKKKGIVDFGSSEGFPFVLSNVRHEHSIVKICIENMIKDASLKPFFKTWDFAVAMKLCKLDQAFIREFSILLFSLYENLLVMLSVHSSPERFKNSLDEIVQLYSIVANMPLKELLVTLEKCYVLFSGVLRDYGFYDSITWSQWFKSYWWVPPTVAIAIIGALLKKSSPSRPSFGSRLYRYVWGENLDYLNKTDEEAEK